MSTRTRAPGQGLARTILLGIPVPVLVVVLWHFGVTYQWELVFGIRMGFLPYPADVAVSLWDFAFGGLRNDAFSGELWVNLAASVGRVAAGFALAAVLAIPLGIFMGRFYVVNSLFDALINLLRPIPATAWVPLVALLIGIGDQATIFLITLSAFFPIVLGTISGARQVPPRLIEGAQMLGSSPLRILYQVVVPASAPAIINGLRIGLGLAWVVLVLGETVGVRVGLGATISLARDIVRTDLIVVGMICIGLAGYLSDRLLVWLFQIVFRGRPLMK
ncbi:ABC transporter permease [Cryobacterium melibiosiphilum]|uniref:ABC transporter permease n=1 Tax=Cryobacterium melibiosiphilum TaxID=995039 RepID=A0A3A5MBG4_9MICO|nr:ABC transporter permease [Cryobacterium melibiosiphilum]RJT87457.1 ABC transporter permease [Cryobacterium melibiosiphilum]